MDDRNELPPASFLLNITIIKAAAAGVLPWHSVMKYITAIYIEL